MSHQKIFNFDEALARVDHDLDILQVMAELFLEHGPKDLAEIKAALVTQDTTAVARSAHRLKGAVLQFCAPAVFEAVKTLEEAGQAGDLTAAVAITAVLETELLRLVEALHQVLEKGRAA
jgi:HPt (histidine-containing phosphotransfer) domain-containing protein